MVLGWIEQGMLSIKKKNCYITWKIDIELK